MRSVGSAISGIAGATVDAMPSAVERLNVGGAPSQTIVIDSQPPRWAATTSRSSSVSAAMRRDPFSGSQRMSAFIRAKSDVRQIGGEQIPTRVQVVQMNRFGHGVDVAGGAGKREDFGSGAGPLHGA